MKSLPRNNLYNALLLLCLLGGAREVYSAEQSTNARNVSLKKGALFVSVRANLIKAGWRPAHIHDSEYEYTGTERILAERHIYEVEACSTDRGSLCIFYYVAKQGCLRIDTVGEKLDEMHVTRWDHTCPKR